MNRSTPRRPIPSVLTPYNSISKKFGPPPTPLDRIHTFAYFFNDDLPKGKFKKKRKKKGWIYPSGWLPGVSLGPKSNQKKIAETASINLTNDLEQKKFTQKNKLPPPHTYANPSFFSSFSTFSSLS